MAIAGPRLDRPSAVGDEGRPRATSLTVAAVVTVLLAVASLWLRGALSTLALLGLAVTLLVAGMALLTRNGFGEQVVGHLCYHPGAVAGVLLVLAIAADRSGLLLAGLFVALLGVGAGWANAFVREDLHDATVAGATSYATTLGWLVVGILALWLGAGTLTVTADLVATTDPVDSLFGFLGFLAVAGVLVRTAIWALPVAALTPRPQRATRRARLARLSRAGTVVALGSVVVVLVVAVLLGTPTVHRVAAANPGVDALLVGLSSPLVLVPAVGLCVLGAVATVGGLAANKVAEQVDAGNDGRLAAAVAGFCFAVLITGYLSELFVGLLVYLPTVLGIVMLAPLAVVTVGFLALAAMDGGFLPVRAAGPALAAAGLFVAGIGAEVAGLPAILVFAFVAGAVVVWDVSTFGLGLTVELGHRPETRRLELYHAVLSIGVGLAAVAVVAGLDYARRTVGTDMGAWPAVGAAVLGAILLAVAVARREA